jgi:hypothetical protein
MKKNLFSLFLLLSVTFFAQSCRDRDNVDIVYRNGLLIINEGDFSKANGNISFYGFDTQSVNRDVIKAQNNDVGINATIQKTFDDRTNNRLYVVCNAPDKLSIFDGGTLKLQGELTTGLTNPFGVAVANGKAFVSEWGTTDFVNYPNAKIHVIDANSRQIVSSILVGKEVNDMLELGGKIYAAVTGADKIWIINSITNQKEGEISTSAKPSTMTIDANGKIWVLCSSGNLDRLNPNNNTKETTIANVSIVGYNEKIAIDASRTNLYWVGQSSAGFTGKGVFRMAITENTAPNTPLIPLTTAGTVFYGLYVNSNRNQIVLGVTNYSSIQEVHFYNTSGQFGSKVNADGSLPNGFLLR